MIFQAPVLDGSAIVDRVRGKLTPLTADDADCADHFWNPIERTAIFRLKSVLSASSAVKARNSSRIYLQRRDVNLFP